MYTVHVDRQIYTSFNFWPMVHWICNYDKLTHPPIDAHWLSLLSICTEEWNCSKVWCLCFVRSCKILLPLLFFFSSSFSIVITFLLPDVYNWRRKTGRACRERLCGWISNSIELALHNSFDILTLTHLNHSVCEFCGAYMLRAADVSLSSTLLVLAVCSWLG